MPKAGIETNTNTNDLDAEIFDMGRRHDDAYDEWSRLSDDDPRADELIDTAIDLAHRMMLVLVQTPSGIAEKRRVAKRQDLVIDSNHYTTMAGPDFIEFICQLDAERIATAV
jgi:hypothetical protein